MPHEMVLEGVVETLIGGELKHPAWRVDMMKPDVGIEGHWFNGTLHNQHIPKAAAEWRMAEYGMEPDEAMDLLLHEPFIETVLDLPEKEDVSLMAKTMRTVEVQGVTEEVPIDLFNAETLDEAAEAVRTRLTVVKRRLTLVSKNVTRKTLLGTPVDDPIEFMKKTLSVTKRGVEEKRQFVTAMRQEQGRDGHLPPAKLPPRYAVAATRRTPKMPQADGASLRIMEQIQDPKDRMWG